MKIKQYYFVIFLFQVSPEASGSSFNRKARKDLRKGRKGKETLRLRDFARLFRPAKKKKLAILA
ncbi:hypothetical protein [Flavobacterium sp. LC2016-01]|uniref:hypothetical protein n=1 Tax=Flavobacterium sp. LC2016-01 TaxID=2675876 RepID=UPI0012BAC84D|nr:hypothetical protein [Flavobacterium sp. LC2016-01]MTH14652.1 hypothetical protein [Flavobacterium sp. LC2016-01]